MRYLYKIFILNKSIQVHLSINIKKKIIAYISGAYLSKIQVQHNTCIIRLRNIQFYKMFIIPITCTHIVSV